ncbi:MAG: FAD-dependent oxidoreductase, partial [Candidatus Anstonellales archaeon]
MKSNDTKYDVIVIGGGPAGISTVMTINATYPDKRVLLIRNDKIPIVPCGMHYLLWKIEEGKEKQYLCDDSLSNYSLDLEIAKVEVIDRVNKKIILNNGKEYSYEKLVIATGSIPNLPDIPGKDANNVFVIKKDFEYIL